MKSKKNKNIDKKIKMAESFENFFRKLGANLGTIKSLSASVLTLGFLLMGTKISYFWCVFPCAVMWGDFIAEETTRYGENICDAICLKFYDKGDSLRKIKAQYNDKISTVDNSEIKKAKNELGIISDEKNIVITNDKKNNIREFDDEKKC